MTISRHVLLIPVLLLAACGGDGNKGTSGSSDTTPTFSDGDETDQETPEETPEETSGFTAGSELARIVAGLQRVVGTTLVGLNQTMASGIDLTEREQECLGSYEPANGQSLLAIQCPDAPYRPSGFPITITTASLVESDSCLTSIFNSEFSSCRVQEAKLEIQTVFEVPPLPEDDETFTPQRPVPVAGAVITYAFEGSNSLTLSNDESGLTGVFSCEYDLQSTELTSSSSSNSCADDARRIADRLEMLAPVL